MIPLHTVHTVVRLWRGDVAIGKEQIAARLGLAEDVVARIVALSDSVEVSDDTRSLRLGNLRDIVWEPVDTAQWSVTTRTYDRSGGLSREVPVPALFADGRWAEAEAIRLVLADEDSHEVINGVRVLHPDDPAEDRATCGHCGRSWDDAVVTGVTPTPSGRCPFEFEHEDDDEDEVTTHLPDTWDAGRVAGSLCGRLLGVELDAQADALVTDPTEREEVTCPDCLAEDEDSPEGRSITIAFAGQSIVVPVPASDERDDEEITDEVLREVQVFVG